MDPAGALSTVALLPIYHCPKDTLDLMDLIDFMDLTDSSH